MGTIIGHRWVHVKEDMYPQAIVSYMIDGQEYQCKQTYKSYTYNSMKHAKQD